MIKIKPFKTYIIAVVAGIAATVAVLAVFALLVFIGIKTDVFSVMAFAAGALVCGYVAGLFGRRRGLLRGIKAALLFTLVFAVAAFVTGGNVALFSRMALAVVCGGVGGVLGVNRRAV
ncbi:hypothetical protein FACS1894133_6380 [Clostridia bacterium]|nr:hypothetical protein FACS1894133_6380 [Clostridia bacterium]